MKQLVLNVGGGSPGRDRALELSKALMGPVSLRAAVVRKRGACQKTRQLYCERARHAVGKLSLENVANLGPSHARYWESKDGKNVKGDGHA